MLLTHCENSIAARIGDVLRSYMHSLEEEIDFVTSLFPKIDEIPSTSIYYSQMTKTIMTLAEIGLCYESIMDSDIDCISPVVFDIEPSSRNGYPVLIKSLSESIAVDALETFCPEIMLLLDVLIESFTECMDEWKRCFPDMMGKCIVSIRDFLILFYKKVSVMMSSMLHFYVECPSDIYIKIIKIAALRKTKQASKMSFDKFIAWSIKIKFCDIHRYILSD